MNNYQLPPVRDTIDYIHAAAILYGLPNESNIRKMLLEQLEEEITPKEYTTPKDRAIELGKVGDFERLTTFVCSQIVPAFTENDQPYFEVTSTLDITIYQFFDK